MVWFLSSIKLASIYGTVSYGILLLTNGTTCLVSAVLVPVLSD